MKQRPEFLFNFGWPDYLYYLQKQPDPPPPRNQLVVPKTNQEINEPSYEMVGVKITVTNYEQYKLYKSVIMNDTGPHLGKSKHNQEISEFKILVGTNISHVQTV
jgi:hypothetical protein